MTWQEMTFHVMSVVRDNPRKKKIEIARILGISTTLLFEYQVLYKHFDDVKQFSSREKAYAKAREIYYRATMGNGDTFSTDERVTLHLNVNPNRELRKFHSSSNLTVIHEYQLNAYPDVKDHLFPLGKEHSFCLIITTSPKISTVQNMARSLGFRPVMEPLYLIKPHGERQMYINVVVPIIVCTKGSPVILKDTKNVIHCEGHDTNTVYQHQVADNAVDTIISDMILKGSTIVEPVCEGGEWGMNHEMNFVGICPKPHNYQLVRSKVMI